MSEKSLIIDIDKRGVATLTMNRPTLHNAFDDALIAEMTAQLQTLDNDPAVKVILLAAAGKSFSAGADLNWMKRMVAYTKEENHRDAMALGELMRTLNFVSKPTIAAVQGAAYGGGVGLVACCDIVIASEKASFCLSEVKLGLIPAVISPYVVRAIGAQASRRYFLTAERFDVNTAQQLGLVHEVVAPDALNEKVESMVSGLLQNGPCAVAAAKSLVFAVEHGDVDAAMIEDTAERIAALRISPEGQEGLGAFLEKRRPAWQDV